MNIPKQFPILKMPWVLSMVLSGFLFGCATGSGPGDTPVIAPTRTAAKGSVNYTKSIESEEASGGSKQASGNKAPTDLLEALQSKREFRIQQEAGKVLADNPDDPSALNALAIMHWQQGRMGMARMLLNRILEKNKDFAGVYNNLGVLSLAEDDVRVALAYFRKALELDAANPAACGNLGSIYVQNEAFEKAAPLLSIAYRSYEGDARIANNYAVSLRAQNDLKGAQKIYEKLLEKQASNETVLLNYAVLLIDYMNQNEKGLEVLDRLKFVGGSDAQTRNRMNELEKKAKSSIK